MKDIFYKYYFLLLWVVSHFYSQENTPVLITEKTGDTSLTYYSVMRQLVSTLDKTKIESKILLDISLHRNSLDNYTGEKNDTLVVNFDLWKDIYFYLRNSIIDSENVNLMSLKYIDSCSNYYRLNSNEILINILYFKYNCFKENVFEDSLIVFQNGIYHVNVDEESKLYDEKRIYVASSAKNIFYTNIINFKLTDDFIYTNSFNDLRSIYIDFDDGNGYRLIHNGEHGELSKMIQLINVNYNTIGDKNVKTKLILSSGDTLYSNFLVSY